MILDFVVVPFVSVVFFATFVPFVSVASVGLKTI